MKAQPHEKKDEKNLLEYYLSLKNQLEQFYYEYATQMKQKDRDAVTMRGMDKLRELLDKFQGRRPNPELVAQHYGDFVAIEDAMSPYVRQAWYNEFSASLDDPQRYDRGTSQMFIVKPLFGRKNLNQTHTTGDKFITASVVDKNFTRLEDQSGIGILYRPKSPNAFIGFCTEDAGLSTSSALESPERFPKKVGGQSLTTEKRIDKLFAPYHYMRASEHNARGGDYNQVILDGNELEPFAVMKFRAQYDYGRPSQDFKHYGIDARKLATELELPLMTYECETKTYNLNIKSATQLSMTNPFISRNHQLEQE
jgi:hypothetical protein